MFNYKGYMTSFQNFTPHIKVLLSSVIFF